MASTAVVLDIATKVSKAVKDKDSERVVKLLGALGRFKMPVAILVETRVGLMFNKLRKQEPDLSPKAKSMFKALIKGWKSSVEGGTDKGKGGQGAVTKARTSADVYIPQAIVARQGEATLRAAAAAPPWRPKPRLSPASAASSSSALCSADASHGKRVVARARAAVLRPQAVRSLREACLGVLKDNIEFLGPVGDVPAEVLMPVLRHCTPLQLRALEEYNPQFLSSTPPLWKKHCQRSLPAMPRQAERDWRSLWWSWHTSRQQHFNQVQAKLKDAYQTSKSSKPRAKILDVDSIPSSTKASPWKETAASRERRRQAALAKKRKHAHMAEKRRGGPAKLGFADALARRKRAKVE